jgi:hypothetical protein
MLYVARLKLRGSGMMVATSFAMKNHWTTTLVALGFSGAALLQSAASFDEVDQNDDGSISQEEASAVGLDLSSADINQDRALDRDEYRQATGEE